MTPKHSFRDEWLVRAARELGLTPAQIEELRARREPSLAAAALREKFVDAARLRETVLKIFRVKSLPDPVPAADKMAMGLVPERLCRADRLAPLTLGEETLEVAMENPTNLEALDSVRAVSGRTPIALYALPEQLDGLLSKAYDPDHVVYDLVERINDTSSVELLGDDSRLSEEDKTVKAPVMRLINSIIAKAVAMRASDIHLEHDERASVVRYRIDGSLKTVMNLPKYVGTGPAVSRLKIMANLDIADHLRPQDGRAKLRIDGVEIGLRVSTLPTNYGEKVVVRILDKRAASVPFEKLGLRADIAERLHHLMKSAQGFILVTGPTGSGKTTTLYSMLNMLRGDDTNIVTVEDPIEYKLDGINQVQVQEKQGLTFASVLRSVLRQDPDVILVGEIRDRETAEVAVQAAATGHLVFSTLHTNDSVAALARLADMGVEGHKLAPALLAVTAQRLVRRLCACRVESTDERGATVAAAAMTRRGIKPAFYQAKGCENCEFAGYKGRLSIVELLEISAELRERITAKASPAALTELALSKGELKPLIDDALRRVASGETALSEVAPYLNFDEPAGPGATVPAAAKAEVAAVPVNGKGAGRRVLIVDDDATIRMVTRMVLEKNGYAVTESEDGRDAVAKIVADAPDMLIVDLMMPGMNGHEVIRAVRVGMGLDLPIVMMTADSDDKNQETALALGADDYVVKPVKPAILAARVNAVFNRRAS